MADPLSFAAAPVPPSTTPAGPVAAVRALAVAGQAAAQATYAQMLLDGSAVPADPRAALGWFTRAAAQHHPMALNMVGRCYDLGWGTTIDKARAAACYRVAAERGLAWAMYNYATLLALGEGVAQDRAAALAWLERAVAADEAAADGGAADDGEADSVGAGAKAINFVGSFAEDGWAGPVDMAKAARCYARAAAAGDFRGCFNHARMLAQIDAALPWLRQAAARGNPRFVAQLLDWLGHCPWPGFADRGAAAVREAAGC